MGGIKVLHSSVIFGWVSGLVSISSHSGQRCVLNLHWVWSKHLPLDVIKNQGLRHFWFLSIYSTWDISMLIMLEIIDVSLLFNFCEFCFSTTSGFLCIGWLLWYCWSLNQGYGGCTFTGSQVRLPRGLSNKLSCPTFLVDLRWLSVLLRVDVLFNFIIGVVQYAEELTGCC